jgi:hypothetical protein
MSGVEFGAFQLDVNGMNVEDEFSSVSVGGAVAGSENGERREREQARAKLTWFSTKPFGEAIAALSRERGLGVDALSLIATGPVLFEREFPEYAI